MYDPPILVKVLVVALAVAAIGFFVKAWTLTIRFRRRKRK